jgi:CubicO group peptidase (beta-lactamase class C family)
MQPFNNLYRLSQKSVMKKIYFLLSILSLLAISNINAQKISISEAKLQKIESIISESYKDDQPGISYLIAQGDKILVQKGIGMSEMEFGIKIEPDHIFAIGSVSKQFTAIAMLKLVELGKVKLDADIKTYLPNYNTHGEKITIANLLSHTSGISSFTEMESFGDLYKVDKTKEEIRKCFEDSALLFKPNTFWSYSNSGYVLAGLIIEKVTGIDLHEFMQKNIFDVAGMKHTYFGTNTKIYGKKAYGYDADENEKVGKSTEYSWTWPLGAGDILSTTGDLYLWHKALTEGKIISKENVKLAFTEYKLLDGRSTHYGFGWGLNTINNKTIVEHGGAIGGFLSETARINEDQIYVIMLSNNTTIAPSKTMANVIITLLELPDGNPAKLSNTPDYNELVGSYEVNFDGGRVTSNSTKEKIYRYITSENGKLFIQRTGRGKLELLPYDKDSYFIDGGSQRFVFLRDKKNKVFALDVQSYPLQFGPTDICKLTNAPLPVTNASIKVDAAILNTYVGRYELAPSFILEVTVEGDRIFCQATGQQKFEIYPTSNTNFFLKVVDAKIDFNVAADGKVISLFLIQGRKMEAKRL